MALRSDLGRIEGDVLEKGRGLEGDRRVLGLDGKSPVSRSPLPHMFAREPHDQMNFMIHWIATPGQAG